ncbi:MAG: hypothetical protein HFH59_11460 [Lachnospiraceae bacterium]|nr:hypothetical protein [Lachnospiraceae bacterium]MCI9099487.1 hypothetical protein [Lachnospiraceae bacterium]MCI9358136.1 hypothetical protein [Lachnospiraceae bacterium]
MEQICVLSFLSVNSFQDIRKKQVYLSAVVVYGILGILYIFLHRDHLEVLLLGALPGILLMCVGKISGGALGLGDGLAVMISGIYMGIWKTLEFIALSLLMAAVWAGFLMFVKKKGRKASFPFVPFMLAAYVVLCLIQTVEG